MDDLYFISSSILVVLVMHLTEAAKDRRYIFIKHIFPLAANAIIFWFAGIFQTITYRKFQVLKLLV